MKIGRSLIERLIIGGLIGRFWQQFMSDGEIICRPTKWFYLRAIAMTAMFAVFFVLFMKDWKIGYPKKNEVYYTFQAFKKAEEAFLEHEEDGLGAAAWEKFAKEQKIGFPEEEGVLPASVDLEAGWPEGLTEYEGYKEAVKSEGNKANPPMWTTYTDERGWSSTAPAKSYSGAKVREQLYFGAGSGVLMVVALVVLLRISRRSMRVDDEAYYAPGGARIPFRDIRRIDKRKWTTKGLAFLFYEVGGALRKVKVDGMVYGQFKADEGAPAERLFERILANFAGELIELAEEEEEEESEAADAEDQAAGEDGENSESAS